MLMVLSMSSLRHRAKKREKKTVDLPRELEARIERIKDPRRDRRAQFVEDVLGFLRDLAEKYSKIDRERGKKLILAFNDLEHWWYSDLDYFTSKTVRIDGKDLITIYGKVLSSETYEFPSSYLFSGLASGTLFYNSLFFLEEGVLYFIEQLSSIKHELESKGSSKAVIIEIENDLNKLEEILDKTRALEKGYYVS